MEPKEEDILEYRDCPICGPGETATIREQGRISVVRCRTCGLVFRNPIIKDSALLLNVPEEEKRADYSELMFRSRRGMLSRLLRRAERHRKPPGRLLDIGCGFGHLMTIAKESGWEASGVEIEKGAVNHCRERGLDVFGGTLEELNPAPESFDAVALIESCEYFARPIDELRRIRAALKPGGVLLVRTLNQNFHLNAHRLYKKLERLFSRFGLRDPSIFHRFTYSPRNFRAMAEAAGLRVLETAPSPLVRNDPYGYLGRLRLKTVFFLFSAAFETAARLAFALSGGRIVASPSFVAVCRRNDPPLPAKVLHVITRMDQGGSAIDTCDLALEADREKFEVHLLCGSFDQFTDAEERELRAACATFTIEPSLKRDINPAADLAALFKLYRFMRAGRFDIVHTHTSKAGFIGRLAARLAGVPVIVHSPHGHIFYGYFGKLKTKMFIILEKISIKATDRLLCLTPLEIEDHLDLGIGRREQYDVLVSGVRLERFAMPETLPEEVRAGLGIPENAPVIGVVARLDPVKGVRYAIEALALLPCDDPAPHLLLIGDGGERAELELLARGRGVADRVHFLGLRRDVPDLLHAMDVFLLPSLNEGYGKAIVEAMSAGRPVVASNVGGVPHLIKDGENGLLVPPADPRAIADALGKIIGSPERAALLAAAGRNSVTEEFEVAAMVRKLENIYLNLLK